MTRRAFTSVALVLLAACGGEKPAATTTAPSTAPKTLTKVRFNQNPTLAFAPMMVAKAEGFFAEEGIDAEPVSIDQNSALVALTAGELDVLSGPIRSGYFNVMLRNAPLRIVADKGQLNPKDCVIEAFAAAPEISARIAKKGGSLKGEKFALIRGGFTEFMLDRYLAHEKLTRDDIEMVQIPATDSMITRTRKIDAIRYVQEPTLSNSLSQQLVQVLMPAEKVSPHQQHGLMLFGKRLRDDDPELGRRFMRAYLRGVRRYNEGKTPRNVEILAEATTMSKEIIERACWLPMANDGRVNMDSVNDVLAWSKERGYLDGDIPLETWWDPRFVDAANSALASSKALASR